MFYAGQLMFKLAISPRMLCPGVDAGGGVGESKLIKLGTSLSPPPPHQLMTDVPEATTDVLQVVTDVPEVTTDVPEVMTDVPEVTTDVLEVMADVPSPMTDVLEVMTVVPEVTTELGRQ